MKKRLISARVDTDLYSELQAVAEREHRPVANLMIKILLDWRKARKEAPPKPNGAHAPIVRASKP